jgi:GntR family transcriptional regulator, transcriptional repressor for pyruvate dehydrogenase complex
MPRTTRDSASLTTAAAIRRDVLRIAEDGRFLGSEDDLLMRYGVSRPTLRQAARILEHEQLIRVRRGVNGGFFTRLPTSEAVSRVASVFLQVKGTELKDLFRAVAVITPSIAEMACSAPREKREVFHTWTVDSHRLVASMSRREFLVHVTEHGRRLGELAGCPPLALFQNVLMELTLAESKVNVFAERERMTIVADRQLSIAEAVLQGNGKQARRLTEASELRTAGWIDESPATESERLHSKRP